MPFAFPFRSTDGHLDFVLVSVHLKPGDSRSDMSRRSVELSAIDDWIQRNNDVEKDFLVLGDMNFKNCDEIGTAVPSGLSSLNEACLTTNTNINGPRPYDNVLYYEDSTVRTRWRFSDSWLEILSSRCVTIGTQRRVTIPATRTNTIDSGRSTRTTIRWCFG